MHQSAVFKESAESAEKNMRKLAVASVAFLVPSAHQQNLYILLDDLLRILFTDCATMCSLLNNIENQTVYCLCFFNGRLLLLFFERYTKFTLSFRCIRIRQLLTQCELFISTRLIDNPLEFGPVLRTLARAHYSKLRLRLNGKR